MSSSHALRVLLAAALLAATAAPTTAPAATATTQKPGSAGAPAAEEDWSSWIQTLEESAKKLRELRRIESELHAAVKRAKSERYPRGEERERLFAAHERAKADLAEAERQHPELLEQARQAGVPGGLLQDYEVLDEAPAASE